MKSFRIVIPPWYPRSRISRRMTWALVTPSTTTRWVMYSLKGSSLLGCLPRRYRRVGPSFRLRATVLRSIPRRLAISVFDRPFSKSSRTFITSSPRSTESPPLGREFGGSGSLRVRIFHSAISRSFASAVLTHFIPATTQLVERRDPLRDLAAGENPSPRCGDLNRERHPVDQAADAGDRLPLLLGMANPGRHAGLPVDEQPEGGRRLRIQRPGCAAPLRDVAGPRQAGQVDDEYPRQVELPARGVL